MKRYIPVTALLLLLTTCRLHAQHYDTFLETYYFKEKIPNSHSKTATGYQNIAGSPYFNNDFLDAILYVDDSTAVRLPARFNIYSGEMEYLIDGTAYSPGERARLKKVIIGETFFLYEPRIDPATYVELLATGRCSLFQQRRVSYHAGEGPKPIVGTSTPAEFVRESDEWFLAMEGGEPVRIRNMNSVRLFFNKQGTEVESFIRREKLKRFNRQNLIDIVRFFNNLPEKNSEHHLIP